VDITEGRNNYYDLDSHGKEQLTIPVIAAGGIGTVRNASGYGSGADGVQVGSRFAASVESSAHTNFKDTIIEVKEEVRSFKRISSSTSNQKNNFTTIFKSCTTMPPKKI
jgi:NAD(P)H-dependent flavin oxidoreductase YrpB (nitropropane dioxygenase family)